MNHLWSISPEKIDNVVQRIVHTAHPSKIIIFGSAAQGNTDINSDVDILVVTAQDVRSSRKESIRIRRALRDITMPMDILVISEQRLNELADHPGMIYREALQHGKLVYEATR